MPDRPPRAHPGPMAPVALIRDSDGLLDELASQITAAGISVVPQPSAGTGLVIVAAHPRHRVLDAALAAGQPADVVGIRFTGAGDGKPGLTELVLPDVTAAGTAAKARALAAKLGLNAVVSRDRPGFVTATLAYAQFNDAVRMFQDGFASPADIDTAMMLGCGYPRGPLQMLDNADPAHVVGVLEAMHAATGDPHHVELQGCLAPRVTGDLYAWRSCPGLYRRAAISGHPGFCSGFPALPLRCQSRRMAAS